MSKKIIILIIVFVIILALGIGGYFAVKKVIQLGKEKEGAFLQEQIEKGEKGEGILGKLFGGEEGQPAGEGEQPTEGPTSDVPGKDLPDVPRYPGSVRNMCGTIPGLPDAGFYIMYDAPGSAKEVKDFYEEQLPANGWESSLSEEEAKKLREDYKSIGFEFYRFIDQALDKGEQTIVVQVGLSGSDYPGYTDVIITLPSDPFK